MEIKKIYAMLNQIDLFKRIASDYVGTITEENERAYITNKNEICNYYQDGNLTTTGFKRTGFFFGGYGAKKKNDDRFVRLKQTHPKQYEYCLGGGEYNKDGLWQPNVNGLGLKHVFDVLNNLYGKNFIIY